MTGSDKPHNNIDDVNIAQGSVSDDAQESAPDNAKIDASANTRVSNKKESVSKNAQPKPIKPVRSIGSLIVWGAVCILVVLIGVLGAAGYQGWLWYQGVDSQLVKANQRIQTNANTVAAFETELMEYGQGTQQIQKQVQTAVQKSQAQSKEFIRQQSTALTQMGDRLDGMQSRINTMSTTSREDWLLAEAEYLLRLANQRVLLERNAQNAIALLEAADNIIKQVAAGLGDPELFAIRKAVGRELTQLRLLENTDKEGVYIQLSALADEVEHLPRVRKSEITAVENTALINQEDVVTHDEGWGAGLWQVVKDAAGVLDDHIKIDNVDSAAVPLLSSRDALIIAMNVRLLMQQAQLALLKEQPVIYLHSLQKAAALIDEHYIESEPVKRYKQSIKQQMSVNVAPELPDISGSLKLLNGFVKKLHKVEG